MPLLNGRDAARARAVLGDLERRFRRVDARTVADPSLAGGLAGLALVHYHLDRAFPGSGHLSSARAALRRAGAILGARAVLPGLHSGFTGVAWVAEHIGGGPGRVDRCAPIDEALIAWLRSPDWTGPYDLIEGLTGFGVYALERMPGDAAPELLSLVLRRLDEATERDGRGKRLRFRTGENTLENDGSRIEYNVGVAHGVAGVIGFLGAVLRAGVKPRDERLALRLLEGAVAWLLTEELPADAPSRFPGGITSSGARPPARAAWCYGDPGIALALLVAAKAAKRPSWERHALRIGLDAAARAAGDTGVEDAGLCHGAAGLGHVYLRLHRATGDAAFASAARNWLLSALAFREPRRGFAGFTPKGPRKRCDFGLLMGAGGIALALLAGLEDEEPAWDRAFCLSTRAA